MTVAEYNHSVEEYADRLYRFVLKHLGQQHTAEDIVQDCFEKLWLKHEQVSFSRVRSYLFTSAYHTLIDHTRRQKSAAMYEKEGVFAESEAPQSPDLKERLIWALEKIPEIQKTVILLRDYEGYNYEEIGSITGLSESQVKVYIYRGRLTLRKLIGTPEVLV